MPLPIAPDTYPTDLEFLWERYVDQLYVPPPVLREFHGRISEYLNNPARTFWIRSTGDLGRRERKETEKGLAVVGTDNSPAWWIHAQLMTNGVPCQRDFGSFLNQMPCHMFDIKGVKHANHAGWYFAHIEPAKSGNSNWRSFDADELTWRMVRSLHPMNYFFVPNAWGRHLGENRDVIAFFRLKLRQHYADLIETFDRLTSVKDVARASPLTARMPHQPIQTVAAPAARPPDKVPQSGESLGHPCLLLRINDSYRDDMPVQALYEATRGVWRIGSARANVRFACAVSGGVIREVYTVHAWHPAGTLIYETRTRRDVEMEGRFEFSGEVAPDEIRSRLIHRSVGHYFPRGAANPVKYVHL